MTPVRRSAILSLHYAPEPTGNAPYVTSLATHLASEGDATHVFTAHPHYPQWRRYSGYAGFRSAKNERGARVVRLWHPVPSPPRGWRRLISEVAFGAHQACQRWRRPDIIVLVSPALFASAICLARTRPSRRTATVVWVQDLYSQGMSETGEGGGLATRVTRAIESWTLRNAGHVVAVHASMADRIVGTLGVARNRVTVVPNWSHIAPHEVDRNAVRARLGWRPDQKVVLHAGNMGRKQGLSNVIEAARIADQDPHNQLLFVLLGDGAERQQLEGLAEGVSAVRFIDPVPDGQLFEVLSSADALLVNELPGVKEMAAPSKLTSYFATGRPVIAASAHDGIVAAIMKAANAGPLVASGDPGSLVGAANDLTGDSSRADRYGESAREYWLENLGPQQALAAWDRVLLAVT